MQAGAHTLATARRIEDLKWCWCAVLFAFGNDGWFGFENGCRFDGGWLCRSDVGEEVKRTELDLYISSFSKIILSSRRDKRSTYRSIKCFVAGDENVCLSDTDQIRLVV